MFSGKTSQLSAASLAQDKPEECLGFSQVHASLDSPLLLPRNFVQGAGQGGI